MLSEEQKQGLASNTLHTIVVEGDPLAEGDIELIITALKEPDSALTQLTLINAELSPSEATNLFEALAQSPAIRSLTFGLNAPYDEQCYGEEKQCEILLCGWAISEFLRQTRTLETLVLSRCPLYLQDSYGITASLASSQTVTTLQLDNNSLDKDAYEGIAIALQSNANLRVLKFEGNDMHNQYLNTLIEALKSRETGVELDFSHTNFQNVSPESIGRLLALNSLTHLVLDNNHLTVPQMRAIHDGLRSNTTLQFLSLKACGTGRFFTSGVTNLRLQLVLNEEDGAATSELPTSSQFTFGEEPPLVTGVALETNPQGV